MSILFLFIFKDHSENITGEVEALGGGRFRHLKEVWVPRFNNFVNKFMFVYIYFSLCIPKITYILACIISFFKQGG